MKRTTTMIDGNEAAAHVAFRASEVIAIYPITPSSTMGELADQWSSEGRTNIWGATPLVQEMQSEGGAAGTIHGALQTGSLATTFTASQGLLLMIPNMFKIAGELTSTVFHVAARSIAAHGLSIFGDHSDVMAARSTGWGMLFANSPQEAMDLALVAHAATLRTRLPFVHAFDGFRTSHEVASVEPVSDDVVRAMIDDELVAAHRNRGLSPDHPFIRGTAQNPDVFFQARESVNRFYLDAPEIVQRTMDEFQMLTGRAYTLFDYVGDDDAERVIVAMGSGCEAVEETIDHLTRQGKKVGLVKVRLYRPFAARHLIAALPPTVRSIAVLDRTKEPGSAGEPLYQDVVTAIADAFASGVIDRFPRIVGGRYGLSSKEFTPAMVCGVFDELERPNPKNHFTVGIDDDVTHTSIPYARAFSLERDDTVRAIFWGLGADGTVGANKNTVKIIGEGAAESDGEPVYAQGYFVYDSKKSGARTVSHLRFGPRPIHSTYLIERASFIGVHQFGFLERYDVLEHADDGAVVLLNSPYGPDDVWERLPRRVQDQIVDRRLTLHVIDAVKVAAAAGMGNRINTIMQVCFFAISDVLPRDEAIARIKKSIAKTYGARGESVVQRNYAAVDAALEHLHQVAVPSSATGTLEIPPIVPAGAPDFVRSVTAEILADRGDALPVSAMPVDGTWPSATSQYEKRNIALEIPVWESDLCIQCGKCVLLCPHSAIRAAIYDESMLASAPSTFKGVAARWRDLTGKLYTLQVAAEDCTGCAVCVDVCPVIAKDDPHRKAVNMRSQAPLRAGERANWEFFQGLEEHQPDGIPYTNVKNIQILQPLFEFSGACAGCGETPYLSLMTRLFGDRAIVANATGCASIFGGNLPTTPWCTNAAGRGPAWSNSLFEDNAEFGLGMRLAVDRQGESARSLLMALAPELDGQLVEELLAADQSTDAGIAQQRERVTRLREQLATIADTSADARRMADVADMLVRKSVWIVGGDGWAYDIGYGGLDHVLTSGRDVNILVLDTGVYSNTGGQASKATPTGAVARFAAAGRRSAKKDLGMMAMTYGNVYVAQIAVGANDLQTLRAFREAEAYPGPSLIIAYAQCVAHGIDMARGMHQQKLAVDSGHWPLYRFNPSLDANGASAFHLDSTAPRVPLEDYIYNESRYRMLVDSDPEIAASLLTEAREQVARQWKRLSEMAGNHQ
jgi:pyruvate-ferredoxin/flavodoxin oxidoreductase